MGDKVFTIVVCTYNGERFLQQCLDALLKLQRLDDYVEEIKVVDNNSSDHTKEIILNYQAQYPIIRYEFEQKQGLTYARRHAVSSITPWVIYVDDDNILDSMWLEELMKTTADHKTGVVNGAVVAKPVEALTEKENAMLHAMYRNLACTHISPPKEDDENTIPMGAGMCVLTCALKKIDAQGWLDLEGRKGSALASGEDTELCSRVFSQGYTYRFNPKMILYHLIPKTRLTEEYSEKLIYGLVDGRIRFIKNNKNATLNVMLRKAKYIFMLWTSGWKIHHSKGNADDYWVNKVQNWQAKAFLRLL